jgi:hypothetical protein
LLPQTPVVVYVVVAGGVVVVVIVVVTVGSSTSQQSILKKFTGSLHVPSGISVPSVQLLQQATDTVTRVAFDYDSAVGFLIATGVILGTRSIEDREILILIRSIES